MDIIKRFDLHTRLYNLFLLLDVELSSSEFLLLVGLNQAVRVFWEVGISIILLLHSFDLFLELLTDVETLCHLRIVAGFK